MNTVPSRFPTAFLFILISVSCQSDRSTGGQPTPVRIQRAALLVPPPSAPSFAPMSIAQPMISYPGSAARNRQLAGQEIRPRMTIMTGELDLEVQDYSAALTTIKAIASVSRGFVVYSVANQTAGDRSGTRSGEATLRIPSPKFDESLARIKAVASRVERETIRGNDVTEEYYDAAARLLNKQKAESQYQKILKRSRTVKEILEVEEVLSRVREEIEQLTGRKKYLADQIEQSSILVRLHEPQAFIVQEPGFGAKLTIGFQRGLRGFADITSLLVTLLVGLGPHVAIAVSGLYWLVRMGRSRSERKTMSQPIP